MARYKKSRRPSRRNRQVRRLEETVALWTEVAALEGRLRAAMGLDSEAFQEFAYGEEYLAPWERYDRLQRLAGEIGVW